MLLDVNGIKEIIPHRYPFLLVDCIEEMEPGVKAVGYKNVTVNEPFFQGHFPQKPVMPGVLIVEAHFSAELIKRNSEGRSYRGTDCAWRLRSSNAKVRWESVGLWLRWMERQHVRPR